jgi:serine/threonine-protein kinase
VSASRPDPALPATIGRYEVVRPIGQGAMGRVLLAHDPVLDRDVAVKLVRDDLKIPADVREGLVVRMRHEARAAARVAHPNLVTLHDMGEDESVGLYLVFEYVEGPTLKERLLEGPLAPHQAARLAKELGAALTFAHQAGVLHRDIKPENVILSNTGGKLADFGIARIPDSTLTHAGGLLGTPAYSAPETFRAGKFSPESDQFSLAASLYEAIAGSRAFPGDDAVAVASLIRSDPPEHFAAARGLTPLVDEVLLRALAKDPADRFPNCKDFGVALATALSQRAAHDGVSALAGTPGSAGRPSSPDPAADISLDTPAMAPLDLPRPERKLSQVVIGAVVIVVTAALLMRTALRSAETTPEETSPAASSAPTASATAAAAKARPPPLPRKERPRAPADPSGNVPAASGDAPERADPDGPEPATSGDAPAQPAGPDAGAGQSPPATSARPSAGSADAGPR